MNRDICYVNKDRLWAHYFNIIKFESLVIKKTLKILIAENVPISKNFEIVIIQVRNLYRIFDFYHYHFFYKNNIQLRT